MTRRRMSSGRGPRSIPHGAVAPRGVPLPEPGPPLRTAGSAPFADAVRRRWGGHRPSRRGIGLVALRLPRSSSVLRLLAPVQVRVSALARPAPTSLAPPPRRERVAIAAAARRAAQSQARARPRIRPPARPTTAAARAIERILRHVERRLVEPAARAGAIPRIAGHVSAVDATVRRSVVPPVARVVSTNAAPVPSAAEVAERRAWGDAPQPPTDLARRVDVPAPQIDTGRLADEVIRAIDRRIIAHRERLGRV